jgi:PAP_fibrillin
MGGGVVRGDSIPVLLSLITPSAMGLNRDNNEAIIAIMEAIASQNKNFVESQRAQDYYEKVSGKWELLWTTEKETLFFIKQGLFGKPVTKVYQTIDTKRATLNNLIEFDGGREFSVLGAISSDPKNKKRVNFKFSSASLKIPPIPTISIPPVGQGWFENIYYNDKYRLSKDVRGDFLVTKRVA